MARPVKQGLDYFPFDVDFFADEKLNIISWEFGLKGEITIIKLLCAVYRNGYFIEWNEKLKCTLLKQLPGISSSLLDQIVKRLVKWSFFDKHLFDTANILTSKGIQRRYKAICSQSRRKTIMQKYNLIDSSKSSANDNTPSSPQSFNNSHYAQPSVDTHKSPTMNPYTVSFADEVHRMAQDSIWIEQGICMKFHIDKSQLPSLLKQFLAHCISYYSEQPHHSYADAKRHFISWYTKERTCSNPPKTNQQPSPSDYTFSGGFGGLDT